MSNDKQLDSGLVRVVIQKPVGVLPAGSVWWVRPEVAKRIEEEGD